MRALGALALALICVGCHRAKSPQAALRLIRQSDPHPPLLVSEVNNTVCETSFRVRNEGEREINVKVAGKSCGCVDLLADDNALKVGDGFSLSRGEAKGIRVVAHVRAYPNTEHISTGTPHAN